MDFGLGEMDFSMDGFAAMDEPDGVEERRYAMLRATPPPTVEYERAVDFCRAMRPEPGLSRFAFVSGNFVLGDILEAWSDMGVRYKSLTVQTLSMSHDNVDSLRNVCDACPAWSGCGSCCRVTFMQTSDTPTAWCRTCTRSWIMRAGRCLRRRSAGRTRRS